MHKQAEILRDEIDKIIAVTKEAIERGQDVSITTKIGLVEVESDGRWKQFERDGSRTITIKVAPFGRDECESVKFYLDPGLKCTKQSANEAAEKMIRHLKVNGVLE